MRWGSARTPAASTSMVVQSCSRVASPAVSHTRPQNMQPRRIDYRMTPSQPRRLLLLCNPQCTPLLRPSFLQSPSPGLAPARLPPARLFLDLCSGADAPVTSALSAMSRRCFRPVDLLSGEKIDLLDDATFAFLERLCASGLVGSAGAAPPSLVLASVRVAHLLSVPLHNLVAGMVSPHHKLRNSGSPRLYIIHVRCRTLLSLVASRGGLIWMEDPTSSLLWLDLQVLSWCRSHASHMASVAACAHSLPVHKAWTFACNRPAISAVASVCPHPEGFHPPISGVRAPDGSFLTRATANYPPSLARALAEIGPGARFGSDSPMDLFAPVSRLLALRPWACGGWCWSLQLCFRVSAIAN